MHNVKNLVVMSVTTIVLLITALTPSLSGADTKISITPGARLSPSTWAGENNDTGESFSSSSTSLGVNVKLQWRDLYAGLSLASGEYEFDANKSPARPTATNILVEDPIKISRGELDLVIGYYVWDMVSLFVDVRSKSLKWSDDYEIDYVGLGAGVTAHYQFSPKWTIFGSVGASSLNIRAKEKNIDESDIGDGTGSALEFGVLYRITKMINLYGTLKSQRQEYNYDNNITETHNVGGATLGVSTVFSL